MLWLVVLLMLSIYVLADAGYPASRTAFPQSPQVSTDIASSLTTAITIIISSSSRTISSSIIISCSIIIGVEARVLHFLGRQMSLLLLFVLTVAVAVVVVIAAAAASSAWSIINNQY